MTNLNPTDPSIIDLGQASLETKGAAGFEIDVSNGRLTYMAGVVED